MNRRSFLFGTTALVALPVAPSLPKYDVMTEMVDLAAPAVDLAKAGSERTVVAAFTQATSIPEWMVAWVDPKIYDILLSSDEELQQWTSS